MGAQYQGHFAYSKNCKVMGAEQWQHVNLANRSNDNFAERESQFYVRMDGDTMSDAGIHDEDLLLVNEELSPSDGSIVIAMIDGKLTVRRYFNIDEHIYLTPENVNYPAIEVSDAGKFKVCGVVTKVIPSWDNHDVVAL